jgi:DNA modification methylase
MNFTNGLREFMSLISRSSTGVACVNTKRGFIGIERDPDYFNIAKERIKKAEMDPRLFV